MGQTILSPSSTSAGAEWLTFSSHTCHIRTDNRQPRYFENRSRMCYRFLKSAGVSLGEVETAYSVGRPTPIRPRARAAKYSPMTTAHDSRLSQS